MSSSKPPMSSSNPPMSSSFSLYCVVLLLFGLSNGIQMFVFARFLFTYSKLFNLKMKSDSVPYVVQKL